MKKEEIDFLIDNSKKIELVHRLEEKLALYIRQRAYKILRSLNDIPTVSKNVYKDYDIYFLYNESGVEYKIDCPIEKDGIFITLCNHLNNEADPDELKKLDISKTVDVFGAKIGGKLILEGPIDFRISDEELTGKLNDYQRLLRVTEKSIN